MLQIHRPQKKSDMCNLIWSFWTHSVNVLFNNLKHMWDHFKWATLYNVIRLFANYKKCFQSTCIDLKLQYFMFLTMIAFTTHSLNVWFLKKIGSNKVQWDKRLLSKYMYIHGETGHWILIWTRNNQHVKHKMYGPTP